MNCSKPTAWDGDAFTCDAIKLLIFSFQAHRVGYQLALLSFAPLEFSHLFLMHRVELKVFLQFFNFRDEPVFLTSRLELKI